MRLLTLFLILVLALSCANREEKKNTQTEETLKQQYLQKGGEIANATQKVLLSNVSRAMKEGGPGYAIDYCSLHALSLKDSLSRLNNCQIRRISLKYRNPVDRPQAEMEEEQLNQYKLAYQKGETIKPEVYLFKDRIEYYQPIFLAMETCLKCHGEPGKQISEETLKEIKARYPDDLATGYGLKDFRGAWKITFKN